ncbi:MAG: hypothetical protein JWL77_4071 [Chthonomonadaceae bacterium]|nr:hypothetical protein [Chthonomonadaceae bacterium]
MTALQAVTREENRLVADAAAEAIRTIQQRADAGSDRDATSR